MLSAQATLGASLKVVVPPAPKPMPPAPTKPPTSNPPTKTTTTKPPTTKVVPPPPTPPSIPTFPTITGAAPIKVEAPPDAAILAAAGITLEQFKTAQAAGVGAGAGTQVLLAGGTEQQAEATAQRVTQQIEQGQTTVTVDQPPTYDPTAFDGFEYDPFFGEGGGLADDAAMAKILRNVKFVAEVRSLCKRFNIDPLAAFANALAEGLSGGIGDGGTAFGPWQIHLEDGRMPQFDNQPTYSPLVQAWAWTANGIEYAIRSMVAGGARGKTGHTAVYDIVYGFERPADEAGAYRIRSNNYDMLKAKGSGADAYLAKIADGPSLSVTPGGGTETTTTTATTKPVSDKPTNNAWKDLVSFLAKDAPFAAQHTESLSGDLTSIFK